MLSLLTTDEAVGDFDDAAIIARTNARPRFQHPTRVAVLTSVRYTQLLSDHSASSTGNILNKAHQILKPTIQLYWLIRDML